MSTLIISILYQFQFPDSTVSYSPMALCIIHASFTDYSKQNNVGIIDFSPHLDFFFQIFQIFYLAFLPTAYLTWQKLSLISKITIANNNNVSFNSVQMF